MQFKITRYPLFAVLFLFSALAITSCKDKKAAAPETVVDAPGKDGQPDYRLGSYVGQFGNNKITVLISIISGDTVKGRSVTAGNNRVFTGVVSKMKEVWHIHATEPGDNPDDGVFDMEIDPAKPGELTGIWNPNDKKKQPKTFALKRKDFIYDESAGIYPQASQRLLLPEDVENEMKEDLNYMRNEIYARHGYCFSRRAMRDMFELEDWYVPNSADIRNDLTDIEKKNIALIKRYEKYAEEYGDEYGR